jgi:hypothetical protein
MKSCSETKQIVAANPGFLVHRPYELDLHHGQARAGTPALQPARRPALHFVNYGIMQSQY